MCDLIGPFGVSQPTISHHPKGHVALDDTGRVPGWAAAALMVPLRLMETWAHGQDAFDALGVSRRPTGRLRHVALLGVLQRRSRAETDLTAVGEDAQKWLDIARVFL